MQDGVLRMTETDMDCGMEADMSLTEDGIAVTFTASGFEYIPAGTVFRFVRGVPSLSSGAWEEVFSWCTGYEGTAGAMLKEAQAACFLLGTVLDARVRQEDRAELVRSIREAAGAFPDGERAELKTNLLEGILPLIESCAADYASRAGAFEDAGVGDDMRELLADPGLQDALESFRSAVEEALS